MNIKWNAGRKEKRHDRVLSAQEVQSLEEVLSSQRQEPRSRQVCSGFSSHCFPEIDGPTCDVSMSTLSHFGSRRKDQRLPRVQTPHLQDCRAGRVLLIQKKSSKEKHYLSLPTILSQPTVAFYVLPLPDQRLLAQETPSHQQVQTKRKEWP